MSYLEQILGQRPYIKKDEEKPYSIFPYPNDGTGTGTPVAVREAPLMYDKFAEQYRAGSAARGNRAPSYVGNYSNVFTDDDGSTLRLPDMSYTDRMNRTTDTYRELMDEAENAYVNASEENDKAVDARIAQLDRQIAEIEEKLKDYSVEEAMGKYKFLWEGDPSTLATYRQGKRNAEQTESIRKATEDASKASTLQQAWKQNGIDLEVARYDVAAAQNAYNEAKANADENGMRRADVELDRARAKLNRVTRENDMLRSKLMDSLGISVEASDELETAGNQGGDEGGNKGGNEGGNLNDDLANAEATKILDDSIDAISSQFDVDNMNIDKKQKRDMVTKGLSDVKDAIKQVEDSSLSRDQKNTRLTKLREIEKKIRKFAKPVNKGGQGTKATVDDYQKALDGMSSIGQLVKKGYNWLVAAKNAGATHQYLDTAISKARGK